MLDPRRGAPRPVAPVGALAGVVAAPAADATAVAASSAVAPVPARRMKRRRLLLRLVSDCIVLIPLSLLCVVVNGVLCMWITRCGERRSVRAWRPDRRGRPRRARRWPVRWPAPRLRPWDW